MGLVLKASKCRSLSIKGGKTTKVPFYLKNHTEEATQIFSVLEKPLKFLSSEVTDDSSPHAMAASLY